MSLQTTLEHYFCSRKRLAADDVKRGSEKVLILDKNELGTFNEADIHERNVIYKESPKISTGKSNVAPKLRRRTPKTVPRSYIASVEENITVKSSAKKCLLDSFNSTELDKHFKNKRESLRKLTAKKSLISSFDATITTEKECKQLENSKTKAAIPTDIIDKINSSNEIFNKDSKNSDLPQKTTAELSKQSHSETTTDNKASKPLDKFKNYDKDLDRSTIKKKLIRSSRLEDLKNALKKLNEGHNKLKEIQSRNNPATPTKSPTLKQFKEIELEVPASPCKMSSTTESIKVPDSPSLLRRAVFLSPSKSAPNTQPYISPKKLFSDTFNRALQRSPDTSSTKQRSFERFYSLACSGKPSFTLPYHYRALAETFRAADTVVSIMQNRGETILFSKLKASVQQLTKKNLLESHLGQIATIFPKAYSFAQEKIRVLGNQLETYELVIKPIFENGEDNDEAKDMMIPSLLLERKRHFYNSLLDIAKTYHEDFLKTLDPPLEVPKDKLTRWHPAFDVESCPDIKAESLPQPPNIGKYTTARDVLNKARDLFVANPRMEKALERLSESSTNTTATSKSIPALANALKGIPKSLLEKVRARQAAKAMELLTRNPSENKRRYELTRLPELARILRNIFVTEKKNIITKPIVIEKMCESYREIMDQTEMRHHLDLLREVIPGWVIISLVDNKEFVKLCKQTDLTEVLAKINHVIQKNSLSL